jgi:hypothetical protein
VTCEGNDGSRREGLGAVWAAGPVPKVPHRHLPLPSRAADHPAMPDIIADWLLILEGCEVTAADLRTLKAHPEFRYYFDGLTGGNADRILDAAAENAERKGYGKKRIRKPTRGPKGSSPHGSHG